MTFDKDAILQNTILLFLSLKNHLPYLLPTSYNLGKKLPNLDFQYVLIGYPPPTLPLHTPHPMLPPYISTARLVFDSTRCPPPKYQPH